LHAASSGASVVCQEYPRVNAWKPTILPICLLLAACAGGKLPGEQPAPGSAYTPSVTAAPHGQTATSLDPPAGSAGERVQQARFAASTSASPMSRSA
jgi:hypothetical protein